MKRFALIFFICMIFAGSSIPAYGGEIKDPKVEALAAIVMDFETGRVMWAKNQYEPMAMASTTKIMTALLTLERGNLDDIVTVSARAAGAPEVRMKLKTGEKIKLDTLMYALMLQSSNDAAVAIAEHISGSVEQFCADMTARARELGAKDTIFETPNGLDAGDHHSTAYDMALITCEALKNPEFIRISNTQSVEAKSDRTTYFISNKNRLLHEYDGANGVKTGFTGKAGHCFVGAAKRGNMQLISVVLASGWGNKGKEQKWVDTKRLLDFGFNNFSHHDIVIAGETSGSINVLRSKTPEIELYFEDGLRLPLTEAETSSVRISVDAPESIMPPVQKGQKIGVAHVSLGQGSIASINLLAKNGADRHDLKTSLEKVFTEWLSMSSVERIPLVLPEF